MNSQQIQDTVEQWVLTKSFDAPYGVLTGSHRSPSGKTVLTVTFGRARTLDATVEIYNRNFMILRTSSRGRQVYRNLQDLQKDLDLL